MATATAVAIAMSILEEVIVAFACKKLILKERFLILLRYLFRVGKIRPSYLTVGPFCQGSLCYHYGDFCGR